MNIESFPTVSAGPEGPGALGKAAAREIELILRQRERAFRLLLGGGFMLGAAILLAILVEMIG